MHKEPHHLLILKENWESISMKTYELFKEATALGAGGHGMDRSCLQIWCGLSRYRLCVSGKIWLFPTPTPTHRTWFNEGHCAALKETRPAEGCHLNRDAEVSITGGLNVSTDKAFYLFGPLNQTKDSEPQISSCCECISLAYSGVICANSTMCHDCLL